MVATALAMMSVDATIVATALHALQRDLDAPIVWTGWTITAFALGLVLVLPAAGKLSERYGQRRMFLVSVGIFTCASLCCGFAGNIYLLVVLRFVQAVGGAGFTPSATGIIVEYFGAGRDKALGLFEGLFAVGAMSGPIFGGLFVTYASWRWIFWVNVPLGVLLMVLAWYFVPADAPARHRWHEPFDGIGMLALGTHVLAVMLAFNALESGFPALVHPAFWVPAAVACGALAFFAGHVRASAHPFIAVPFMVGVGYWPVNLVNVGGGIVEGAVALVPLYAAMRYGLSALESGILLTAQGAAVITSSSLAALGLRHTGYRMPIRIGLGAAALGICALAVPPPGMPAWVWLAGATMVVGIGAGLMSPASRNAGLQLAPANAPTLAALRTMCFSIGSIAAVSLTTAIIAGATDAGAVQAFAYVLWGVLLLAMLPVVRSIREHRGAW